MESVIAYFPFLPWMENLQDFRFWEDWEGGGELKYSIKSYPEWGPAYNKVLVVDVGSLGSARAHDNAVRWEFRFDVAPYTPPGTYYSPAKVAWSTGGSETGDEIRVDPFYAPDGLLTPEQAMASLSGYFSKDERIYTVQAGDVLWRIARAHGLEVQMLADHNGIENLDVIKIGQQIRIPLAEDVAEWAAENLQISADPDWTP